MLSDSFTQLVNERVDIALRYTHQPDDSLIARRLMHIDNVICASAGYLSTAESISTASDLLTHNCLLHHSQTHWEVMLQNKTERLKVTGNLQANDMGVLITAALRGKGVACLPTDLANHYLATGDLIEILPDVIAPGKSLWAVYLSRSYQQTLVRTFIDFLALQWHEDIRTWCRT